MRVGQLLFFAKNLFDLPAQVIPRAVQLARNGGLVFAEQLADLREREIVRVVISQPQSVARRERVECREQYGLQNHKVFFAVGIWGGIRCSYSCRGLARFVIGLVAVVEWIEKPRAAKLINVPLGQDRAQPRGQLAAAVKIIEERFSQALRFAQTVQIAVERIGQFACA